MIKYFSCSILIIILFSCGNINKFKNWEKNRGIIDTLKVNLQNDCKCPKKYTLKCGIYVSNDLNVIDDMAIDLNNDGKMDSLLVFEHTPINTGGSINDYEDETSNYLVEVINYENHSELRDVYPDMISNSGHLLSRFSGIFKTSNGFEIVHQAGAKYSWKVIQNISTADNKKIKLRYIQKICTFDGIDSILTYNTFDTEQMEFKIKDSIQNNCGCDSIWLHLENENY